MSEKKKNISSVFDKDPLKFTKKFIDDKMNTVLNLVKKILKCTFVKNFTNPKTDVSLGHFRGLKVEFVTSPVQLRNARQKVQSIDSLSNKLLSNKHPPQFYE